MAYFIPEPTGNRSEEDLVRDLAADCLDTVRAAIAGLWEHWLNEAGPKARTEIDHAIESMRAGELEDAADAFARLAAAYPGWAEPINKHATALYLQGRCEESIELCREVVLLKPDHFGAWNGMALCALQTGEWLLAREAVLQSLRLQPGSRSNQQLLELVHSRLANC